jgi:hypothetical protein
MPDARNLKERAATFLFPSNLRPAALFALDGNSFGLYVFARTVSFFPPVASKPEGERPPMLQVKDTLRATVKLSFDGRVFKKYHGHDAPARFAKEVEVLRFLERQGCNFVPKLLACDSHKLEIVTSNCGTRVDHLDDKRAHELFNELESFGVRHDDPDMRNVTYRQSDGRFCVVDFELATILPGFH